MCNWGAGEVLAVTPDGERDVMARLAPQTLPFSIDWLPAGRLLVIDGPQRRLLCQEPDGTLGTFADLTGFGPAPFNELVVDAAGNAYLNGGPGPSCAWVKTARFARSPTACVAERHGARR